jgi:hypothetical protein
MQIWRVKLTMERWKMKMTMKPWTMNETNNDLKTSASTSLLVDSSNLVN